MVPILFLISFSIHIALLIVTWRLVHQVKTLKNNQPEAIMDIFETYLEEIKAENRKLQSGSPNKQSHLNNTAKQKKKTSAEEHQIQEASNTETTGSAEKVQTEEKNDVESYKSDVSLSFEANVLHLYSQGLTVEEIAKRLNRGKTEVMLTVKFYNENK